MIVSGFQIVEAALRLLGVVDEDEIPTPAQQRRALEKLNRMLASWSLSKYLIPVVLQELFPISPGSGTLTIGLTGDLSTESPIDIVSGFTRNSDGRDKPLNIRSLDEYGNIPYKDAPGIPEDLYFRHSVPNGTIYLRPVPDISLTIYMELQQALSSVSLVGKLDLPDEYFEAIEYNLAMRLAAIYGVSLRPEVAAIAVDTLKNLRVSHLQPVARVGVDEGLTNASRRGFDIRIGE